MYNKKECQEIYYGVILGEELKNPKYSIINQYRQELETLFNQFRLFNGETIYDSIIYINKAIKFVQNDYFKKNPLIDEKIMSIISNNGCSTNTYIDVLELFFDKNKVAKRSFNDYIEAIYQLVIIYHYDQFDYRKYIKDENICNFFFNFDLVRDNYEEIKKNVEDVRTFFYAFTMIMAYEFLYKNGNYDYLYEYTSNYPKYEEIIKMNGYMSKNNGRDFDDIAFFKNIYTVFGRSHKNIR